MKRKELPFKKLPVLIDGDLTLAESTSILRYIGQLPGAGQWYGDRSVKEKVKIDEYLDFWQSSVHPTAVKLLQNQMMYKVSLLSLTVAEYCISTVAMFLDGLQKV